MFSYGKNLSGGLGTGHILILFLFLGISLRGFGEQAPLLTVRMKGSAEGVGLSARKQAIENAQQHVVEEVLLSMTHSTDKTIFQSILRQASQYVQRYDLLRTDIVGDTTEVEIDAHVLEKPLRHDVAAIMLPRLPRKPSVRLLLADYIGPDAVAGGPTFDIGEAVFRKSLEDFEFPVKGIQDLLDHYEMPQLLDIIQGDVPTTATFARANAEDVVIVGSITTTHQPLSDGSNMLRNRARVAMRIVSGPDGKISDTLTAEAVVQSVDPEEGGMQAAQDACGKLTADCLVGVVLAMAGMEDESRVILRVEQPGAPDIMTVLIDLIRTIEGVSSVEQLFFAATLGRLAVEYSGTMAHFADCMAGQLLNGRKVEVARCVKREITLRFK